MRTYFVAVVVILIYLTSGGLVAQEPFTCKGQYFISLTPNEDLNSGLYEVKIGTDGSKAELISIAKDIGVVLNAMGYRITDNLIYGVNPVTGILSKVGIDGVAKELGRPSGLPPETRYFAGDITPDGRYLILINIDALSRFIAKVDLNSPTFDCTLVQLRDNNVGIVDIAHDPFTGILYGHDLRNKQLITIDPNTGNINRRFAIQTQVDQMGALFFDSFGNLYGYGGYLSSDQNTLIAIDKVTGRMSKLLVGPNSIGQDGCACPYTIEIAKTVDPDTTFACTEVVYHLILSNGSGAPRTGINLLDTFPAGITVKNVLSNPFQGTVSINKNILSIQNMTVNLGIDTIDVLAYVEPHVLGTLYNQAHITGLPQALGSRNISDFPKTAVKNDPTPLTIIPFDIQRFEEDYVVCKGDSVYVDLTLPGVKYQWNDGSSKPIKFLSNAENSVTVSTGCEVKSIDMNLNFVDFDIDIIPDSISVDLGEAVELKWTSTIPINEISYQWTSQNRYIPIDSLAYYYKFYPLFDGKFYLTANDSIGCLSQDDVFIRVNKRREVFFPNIINQNSTQFNNRFYFQSSVPFISGAKWQIYDRWGNLVFALDNFELNNPDYSWDGTFHGMKVEQGVYTWVCEFVYLDGYIETIANTITVIR